MAGPIEDPPIVPPSFPLGTAANPGFSVSHQEVELIVDFASRTITGRTAIRVDPLSKELKHIRLRCRQMEIKAVTVDKWPVPAFDYTDPYTTLRARDGYSAYQHHLIQEKLEKEFGRTEPELTVPLPRQLRIQPVPSACIAAGKDSNLAVPMDPTTPRLLDDSGALFGHFTVYVDYVVRQSRDGIHWVGMQAGDQRYPQVYSYNSTLSGPQSCFVFPCVDTPGTKCTWRFTIQCPRTIADLANPAAAPQTNGNKVNGHVNGTIEHLPESDFDSEDFLSMLSDEEKGLEMAVVCSGYMEDNDVSDAVAQTSTHLTDQGSYRRQGYEKKMGISL
jgi:transcription initiation factor TFIID subunit 2